MQNHPDREEVLALRVQIDILSVAICEIIEKSPPLVRRGGAENIRIFRVRLQSLESEEVEPS